MGARLYVPSGVLLIVLSLLLKLWAMRQWSWFQDDWSYVERTVDLDFWSYVLQEYNGHFMPLQFLAVWVMTWWAPLNYGLATLVLFLVIAAGIVCWWAFLDTVFGRRPQVLLGLALLAFCPLLIQPTLWWAAGMQTYGLVLGMGAVLAATAKYLRTGRAAWLAAVGLCFLLALAAWEKSALIVIPLLFFVLVLPGVDRSQPQWRKRAASLLTVALGMAAAYALVFLWMTSKPVAGDANLGVPGLEPLLGFALTAGLGILAPSLIGGTWTAVGGLQGAFPMAPTWLQWALALAMFSLAGVSVAIRRRAVAILAMPCTYGLIAWGLVVGSSRFGALGQFASLDSRYSADIVPVLVLSLVFLTTSTRQERLGNGAWLVPITYAWSRRAQWTAGIVTVAVTMSCLLTWSTQMDGLGPNSPRSWTDKLLASARAVGPAVLFDSNAPDNVVYPAFLPADARISRMLSPLDLPLSYDRPTPDLLVVSPSGQIVPGSVAQQSRTLPGPSAGCGYALRPGDPPTRVPVSKAMYNWNWGMEIGYLSQGPSVVEVGADLATQVVPLPGGLGAMESVLVSSVTELALSVPAGQSPVCVDYVAFGPVDPAP